MVKERMKKREKEETTPIPRIYHDGLQEVAQQDNQENVAPLDTINLFFNAVQHVHERRGTASEEEEEVQKPPKEAGDHQRQLRGG